MSENFMYSILFDREKFCNKLTYLTIIIILMNESGEGSSNVFSHCNGSS